MSRLFKTFFIYLPLILSLIVLAGCHSKSSPQHPVVWQKNSYSPLFKIGTSGSDTFLQLLNPADTSKTIGTYQWGKSQSIDGYIHLNSRRNVIALSAVFVGMIEALDMENTLIGVDNVQYITSPKTKKRIQNNEIMSYAALGTPDQEKIAASNAELIIGYFLDKSDLKNLDKLKKTDKKVLYFQNFLEKHPLGRAEWIKVFGYLLGKPQKAQELFKEIQTHYEELTAQNKMATIKPIVICNAPYSGTWDIPTGESYMAKIITDAGGNYPWIETKGNGRIPLSIESVFTKAGNAEIWINPGACRKISNIADIDKRLLNFKSVKNQRIYNCTKLLNNDGGNAYWEYGVLRPDLVLQDLSAIFQPEIHSQHSSVFFEPVLQ